MTSLFNRLTSEPLPSIPTARPLSTSARIEGASSDAAMADLPTTAATLEKVTAFIQAHTEVDEDVPILDECPICLDNYQQESAVRITNVAGCNHLIGLSCLTSLLTANPRQDKKCPICRTLWIAAPASEHPGRSPSDDPTLREVLARMARENAPTRSPFRDRRARIPAAITIDSDSSDSSDDEVTVDSYERFSRDIADIRARARNPTVFKRQQRQEEAARTRNASGNRNGSSDRNANDNTSRSRNAHEALTQRSGQNGVQNDLFEAFRANAIRRGASREQQVPRPIHFDALRNTSRVPHTRSPFPFSRLSSPSLDDSDEETTRVANERSKRTGAQETELRDWERRLKERERNLHERERALFEREQRVAQRERKLEKFTNAKEKQLAEMEQMVQRHRNELRRL